jgi:hypothetical protein
VVWALLIATVLVGLIVSPTVSNPEDLDVVHSYAGSAIAPGTNFSFLFAVIIPVWTENASNGAGNASIHVRVSGNWSASGLTWVELEAYTPGAPSCLLPLGCEEGPGNVSGSLQLNVTVTPESVPPPTGGPPTVYLEFCAKGADTVEVTSPIAATVLS